MTEKQGKDFIDIADLDTAALRLILERAKRLKFDLKDGKDQALLKGKHLAMVFEKPSTRTRVSFEVAINQLGGHPIHITQGDSQLKRGESVPDTARVLSRYVDIIMMRTYNHDILQELAKFSRAPVINGLTDNSHPCQVMADILTIEEHVGPIQDQTVTWVGDCNNVAQSWIEAAEKLSFKLNIGCPEALAPPVGTLNDNVSVFTDAIEAVKGSNCVTTDTWVSMGDGDGDEKIEMLKPYQVNDALIEAANENAIFLHCLPAHRGWEVTDSVMDGPNSRVWDEAENRMHVQKAIMLWCLDLL